MTFKGILYNIQDNKGKWVKELSTENRQVIKKILARYKCYIIKAKIKFEKR
jgi:hypothetical protein